MTGLHIFVSAWGVGPWGSSFPPALIRPNIAVWCCVRWLSSSARGCEFLLFHLVVFRYGTKYINSELSSFYQMWLITYIFQAVRNRGDVCQEPWCSAHWGIGWCSLSVLFWYLSSHVGLGVTQGIKGFWMWLREQRAGDGAKILLLFEMYLGIK